ncbi:class I SAM-dependent methyltransferase [Ornithinibacillus californiensis]|uniref:class I SAM-dependent methyltransferase n=1 Tax=Ornithinibacillus californiensis TaxID=161536 RepID=UPI00064DFCCA|nr:class I SAM-dependent methyltransferase [Ornithinibacillus californiensis]
MGEIREIRKREKAYHDSCYENYKLFESGSWLHKPVATVMNLLPTFESYQTLKVLDLGCGVGRNSIPIAEWIRDSEKNGQIVCVDLLDSAIEKLTTYGKDFGVSNIIQPIKASIEYFHIEENTYDFTVAVSSLEHVESMKMLQDVLVKIAKGSKPGGVVCIIINSNLEEIDIETGEDLEVNVEINIPTEDMFQALEEAFFGWSIIKSITKPLAYEITRGSREVLLKTNAITYVVKNER